MSTFGSGVVRRPGKLSERLELSELSEAFYRNRVGRHRCLAVPLEDVVQTFPSLNPASATEIGFIDKYDSISNGYNTFLGAPKRDSLFWARHFRSCTGR